MGIKEEHFPSHEFKSWQLHFFFKFFISSSFLCLLVSCCVIYKTHVSLYWYDTTCLDSLLLKALQTSSLCHVYPIDGISCEDWIDLGKSIFKVNKQKYSIRSLSLTLTRYARKLFFNTGIWQEKHIFYGNFINIEVVSKSIFHLLFWTIILFAVHGI